MSGTTHTSIGDTIRSRREALGLTREGLAYKADVAHKTIERIEGGGSTPRRATVTVITLALDAHEAELEKEAA